MQKPLEGPFKALLEALLLSVGASVLAVVLHALAVILGCWETKRGAYNAKSPH